MKDIILAGTNAHSRTYQQIGECLENAPDLNHSGKPKVHVIGDKASLDKALTDNVIDAVIFVAEEIPASEVSKQELIPVDVELLDTYDFDKNEKNPLVKMGRSAQETGKLNPYFTIVKCRYKLK